MCIYNTLLHSRTSCPSAGKKNKKRRKKHVVDKRFVSFCQAPYEYGCDGALDFVWDIYCIIFFVIVILGCWTCHSMTGQWNYFGLLNHRCCCCCCFLFSFCCNCCANFSSVKWPRVENKQDSFRFTQPMVDGLDEAWASRFGRVSGHTSACKAKLNAKNYAIK